MEMRVTTREFVARRGREPTARDVGTAFVRVTSGGETVAEERFEVLAPDMAAAEEQWLKTGTGRWFGGAVMAASAALTEAGRDEGTVELVDIV